MTVVFVIIYGEQESVAYEKIEQKKKERLKCSQHRPFSQLKPFVIDDTAFVHISFYAEKDSRSKTVVNHS